MTMSATGDVSAPPARVSWSWLWGAKNDVALTLAPFWLGFALIAAILVTIASSGGGTPEALWTVDLAGHHFNLITLAFILYGPLVDGPHLWATIARTYTDKDEWAQRRKLFIGSLLAFAIGPAIILVPYVIDAITPIPASTLGWGWNVWGAAFGFYAFYHINKQHWGFVSLYRRKNGETDPATARVDSLFFNIALWTPWVAMQFAPWPGSLGANLPAVVREIGFDAAHVGFLAASIGYVAFQVQQWRKGAVLNGPKLLYMATIGLLYYATFAFDPRIAALWILITSTGHCVQYHGVVWSYGQKRYEAREDVDRRLPHVIFGNFWLYAVLGVTYALLTLQGPGGNTFKELVSPILQTQVFSHVFGFLSASEGRLLGVQLLAAMISGVRLHHFYVDSKIWRVSANPGLAKNLDVH